MSSYNMLCGKNGMTPFLLAVIGLKENDIERFRDVSSSEDGKEIHVYTRTGGGNRESYPNETMRQLPSWINSVDDDFDSTYCTDTFKVPPQFVNDVKRLSDIMEHGLRKGFVKHLSKTLRRPETEMDKESKAYDQERSEISRLSHYMANGHTFVPKDDHAMEEALKIAEANKGGLRTCWGICPLAIDIKTNFYNWSVDEKNDNITRFKDDYSWKVDKKYWDHCMKKFSKKYPVSMKKISGFVYEMIAKGDFVEG